MKYLRSLLSVTVCWLAVAQAAEQSSRVGVDAYARAERFLYWNADKYIRNAEVAPLWVGPDSFVYVQQTAAGRQFLMVDAALGRVRPAFDHVAMAGALSAALGRSVDAQDLPFSKFEWDAADRSIRFSAAGKQWSCRLQTTRCSAIAAGERPDEIVSPDGQWAAYLKSGNLWVRSLRDRTERALTRDGVEHYAYGTVPGSGGVLGMKTEGGGGLPPVAIWSPDSKRLLTDRLDERLVPELDLIESVPAIGVRPVLHSFRYSMPGDEHKAEAELLIFEVASGKRTDMQHGRLPALMLGPLEEDRAWWSNDSATVYVIPREEGQKKVQLLAMDANNGETHAVIEEHGKTYLEIGGYAVTRAVRTLSDGRVIWYSERDDWGHLYLYDRHGKLIRQITSGPWKVWEIVRVDEGQGRLYFTAVGRERGEDPYQRHLYSIKLDGTGLRVLTPENAEHVIRTPTPEVMRRFDPDAIGPQQAAFSPSGRYFVDTYSRPDLTPVSVLRTAEGRLVRVLERADISALQTGGFVMPEPFSVMAADGRTRLYGTLLRPSNFDAGKKYPIIDVIYPGPQAIGTQKTFKEAIFDRWRRTQDFAELGFIVITVDGRGTPFRSKSFHDMSYGDLGQAGHLDDHVAAIHQLAARYPYMDIDRVGITGHSGGGYASTRAILAYPDFFRVAVSTSGDHDMRTYSAVWAPTYQGPYDATSYESLLNARLAGNLKGKLLLMHGELDNNVHPAQTMQVVNALIAANKDFDFLLLPGENHSVGGRTAAYFYRKQWDYFVRYLLGKEPPANYAIAPPQP